MMSIINRADSKTRVKCKVNYVLVSGKPLLIPVPRFVRQTTTTSTSQPFYPSLGICDSTPVAARRTMQVVDFPASQKILEPNRAANVLE